MAITLVNNSATIGTSEHYLAANSTTPTAQTDDAILQCWIDFGAMAAGDVYEWRSLEKVNAGTQRTLQVGRVVGAQASPVVIVGLVVGDGWDIGVKKISGTDRSIAWSLRKIT